MAKVFGRATIVAGDLALDSNKGASIDIGGVKRTSKMTARGRAGSQEEQMPARVECSIPKTLGVSLTQIQALEDITIKFESDVGDLWTIPHADCMDPPKTDDQSGDVTLVFEGDKALETTG